MSVQFSYVALYIRTFTDSRVTISNE